jgi:hypothetical protein
MNAKLAICTAVIFANVNQFVQFADLESIWHFMVQSMMALQAANRGVMSSDL